MRTATRRLVQRRATMASTLSSARRGMSSPICHSLSPVRTSRSVHMITFSKFRVPASRLSSAWVSPRRLPFTTATWCVNYRFPWTRGPFGNSWWRLFEKMVLRVRSWHQQRWPRSGQAVRHVYIRRGIDASDQGWKGNCSSMCWLEKSRIGGEKGERRDLRLYVLCVSVLLLLRA